MRLPTSSAGARETADGVVVRLAGGGGAGEPDHGPCVGVHRPADALDGEGGEGLDGEVLGIQAQLLHRGLHGGLLSIDGPRRPTAKAVPWVEMKDRDDDPLAVRTGARASGSR